MLSFEERVDLLRSYETDCYRICYFILNCEQLALTAAQHTLFQLLNDDNFFQQDDVYRALRTKYMSKKSALQTHCNHLTDNINDVERILVKQ